MHLNTITQHLKGRTIVLLVPRDTAVTKSCSRFSFRYKLPLPSRLWVHLPLSCAQHFLPLTSYSPPPCPAAPVPSRTTPPQLPNQLQVDEGACDIFIRLFSPSFFPPVPPRHPPRPRSSSNSPPTPSPSPACSCLGAAVLK